MSVSNWSKEGFAVQKLVTVSLICVLCTLGWSARGLGEEIATPRGELRIVDKEPRNWVWMALQVFEHLAEVDKDGALVPRLATGWRWLDERTLALSILGRRSSTIWISQRRSRPGISP